jgi:hypothetical protein
MFAGEKQPHPGFLQDENIELNWPATKVQAR